MVAQNLRRHEVLGLVYQFLGASSIGIGIYYAVWAATRSIYYRSVATVSGWEWLLFPLLFGVGAVLWSLGHIELKEAQPGYGVRK
jgi:hypothetical protein